ncbi:hypothetical protein [Paucisalibacillus globulus]|uniref:hypothetical protein n=1 Tax=Paucisalibacillus globulus TaxID=351095 RepID=UPI0015967BFA|nr:hypothetical protein [Paucisalibacillus globulus]
MNNKLTAEHIFPFGLISKFPEYKYAFLGEKKAVKLSPKKQVIKDVCQNCNNGALSKLDSYGNKFIMDYFSRNLSPEQIVTIRYDYQILLKWVMKILFNSLRKNDSSSWLKKNSKYMIGKVEKTTSEVSLFLGTYVDLAPFQNMFPSLPFQGISEPKILLSSRAFHKEILEYRNENIEIIYVLRLCNAIFLLVCWKENRWNSKEEEALNGLIPHTLLTPNNNTGKIARSTDSFNCEHLYLVSSKKAQFEHDIYMKMIVRKK